MQLSDPPMPRIEVAEPVSLQRAAPATANAAPRRRPVTERIACWSARHRVIALIGWLVMVGGAFLAGQVFGTQSQPQYDPGQSGVAQRMLHHLNGVSP